MITARDAGSVHQRSPHAACVVCLWPASHQRRSPRPSPPPWPGPPPTPCWPPRAPARLNRTGCWVWPAASVATSGPGSSPSAGGCPSTPARLTRSRPRCAVHRPGPALTRTAAHHPSEPEPARHDGSRAAATVRFATQGLRDSANSRASLFDLVHLDGRLLTGLPYAERRDLLEGLGLTGPSWSTPAAITGHGAEAWEMAREAGLEGLL